MVKSFLDIRQVGNYKLVEKLLKSLQDIGAIMSIKDPFLHSHPDNFPDNYVNESDEQEKQFHPDIKTIEDCHQGQGYKRMIADNCWSIKRDLNNIEHDRQSSKRNFLP